MRQRSAAPSVASMLQETPERKRGVTGAPPVPATPTPVRSVAPAQPAVQTPSAQTSSAQNPGSVRAKRAALRAAQTSQPSSSNAVSDVEASSMVIMAEYITGNRDDPTPLPLRSN